MYGLLSESHIHNRGITESFTVVQRFMYTDFPLLMKSSIMSWHTSFKKYEKYEEYGSRWEKS